MVIKPSLNSFTRIPSRGRDRSSRWPRGPIFMMAAGLVFVIMISLVKIAREELIALELMFWRSAISLPIAAAMSIGHRIELRHGSLKTLALRSGFGFLAMLSSYHATKGLSVADLNILAKLQPIFVAVFAPLFLGPSEKAPRSLRWIILLGCLGGAFIIGPDLALGSTYGLWGIAATLASAAAHLCIRGATRTNNPKIVVLVFQAIVLLLSSTWIAFDPHIDFQLPDSKWWPFVIGIGVTSTIGQLLLSHAYQQDKAPTVAAAAYVSPIWSIMADILLFATIPDAWILLGGAMIVGAGIKLIYTGNEASHSPSLRSKSKSDSSGSHSDATPNNQPYER